MQTAAIKEQAEINGIPHDPDILSGEDLFDMGDIGRSELVKGKLLLMAPTGYEHGISENRIGSLLREHVNQKGIGEVLTGEVGIYTRRSPDTVRGADVLYISNERFQNVKSKSYLDVAPELIVEVLSPGDRWVNMMEKLEEYFSIGVKVVWIADPKHRTIRVYRSSTSVEQFSDGDILTCEDVLPGFACKVAGLFRYEDR